MAFKRMAIEINAEQTVDAVVAELERLGYRKIMWSRLNEVVEIRTYEKKGLFSNYLYSEKDENFTPTTLQQLREM